MSEREREPIVHEVKSWPPFFDAIRDGRKPFDVRYNDRGYRIGDTLLLREWEPVKGIYSGVQCSRLITCVFPDDEIEAVSPASDAVLDGWVVLGLKEKQP